MLLLPKVSKMRNSNSSITSAVAAFILFAAASPVSAAIMVTSLSTTTVNGAGSAAATLTTSTDSQLSFNGSISGDLSGGLPFSSTTIQFNVDEVASYVLDISVSASVETGRTAAVGSLAGPGISDQVGVGAPPTPSSQSMTFLGVLAPGNTYMLSGSATGISPGLGNANYSVSLTVTKQQSVVPEPGTVVIWCLGLTGVVFGAHLRRRRYKA